MKKEEHELTADEKCVACTYIYKTRGSIRAALEDYLRGEGLVIGIENPNNTISSEFIYWGVRLLILLISFVLVTLTVNIIKSTVFHSATQFGIIEIIFVGLGGLGIFVFVDDKFLE